MKRWKKIFFALLSMINLFISPLFAIDVIDPRLKNPKQIVFSPKLFMQAMATNISEIRKELDTGDIKRITLYAKSITALTIFIPILYGETFKSEYPFGGNKYFLKETSLSEIEVMVSKSY